MPLALNAQSSLIPCELPEEHSPSHTQLQHIWVVTGPAGCGKTTICEYLRHSLGVPFLEGDDYHPESNKDKMRNGVPLADEDRWDWLIALREATLQALSPSQRNNFHPPKSVIVPCSALKEKYREVMRIAVYGSSQIKIHFIYLKVSEVTLMQRVNLREGHYMKSNMVRSQLQALEEPQKSEWDVTTINVEGSAEQVQRHVLSLVCSGITKDSQSV
ncbi:hypothetical protein AtubIFM57143_004816 [Aspergillus tubingensis]|nr:hypothetical protein AtubIFM57143_004816 [Aspergillus tubingensis]